VLWRVNHRLLSRLISTKPRVVLSSVKTNLREEKKRAEEMSKTIDSFFKSTTKRKKPADQDTEQPAAADSTSKQEKSAEDESESKVMPSTIKIEAVQTYGDLAKTLDGSWRELLEEEFKKGYWKELLKFLVAEEKRKVAVFPPVNQVRERERERERDECCEMELIVCGLLTVCMGVWTGVYCV
jgi:hypothetical protein